MAYLQHEVIYARERAGVGDPHPQEPLGKLDWNGNQVRTTYNVDGNPVLERACDYLGENEVDPLLGI